MENLLDYPNPLKRRTNTRLICGEYSFSRDGEKWSNISVPYCPESELSGVGYKDFIPLCYYKRKFTIGDIGDNRAILHFGAVNYYAEAYINGAFVGSHKGGYTPFEFDITDFIRGGENELLVRVRTGDIYNSARGKQSYKRQSFGCFYTRVTGIWQPVWLEFAPKNRIRDFYFRPDTANSRVNVELLTYGKGNYRIRAYYDGREVGSAAGEVAYKTEFALDLSETHLWREGEGNLYDVTIEYEGDEVSSYFGLRETRYDGMEYTLNGKPIFQRFVMDQGYYPGGVYTPRGAMEFAEDIERGKALGFNGVRLHQKLSDPRLLYLCDKAGYMAWGEYPSWGIDYSDLSHLGQFLAEWEEALRRDFNHPSIITWCPLNEVWGAWEEPDKIGDGRFAATVYEFTKRFDPDRPCVDVSGGVHGEKTDLFDFHSYEKLDDLQRYFRELDEEDRLEVPLLYCEKTDSRYRKGQPVAFSECGGIALAAEYATAETSEVNRGAVLSESGWGYGKREKEGEEFVARYEKLITLVQSAKKLSGFCYTQLYDVEQEVNGFYRADRSDKLTEFQKRRIREVNLKRV